MAANMSLPTMPRITDDDDAEASEPGTDSKKSYSPYVIGAAGAAGAAGAGAAGKAGDGSREPGDGTPAEPVAPGAGETSGEPTLPLPPLWSHNEGPGKCPPCACVTSRSTTRPMNGAWPRIQSSRTVNTID